MLDASPSKWWMMMVVAASWSGSHRDRHVPSALEMESGCLKCHIAPKKNIIQIMIPKNPDLATAPIA